MVTCALSSTFGHASGVAYIFLPLCREEKSRRMRLRWTYQRTTINTLPVRSQSMPMSVALTLDIEKRPLPRQAGEPDQRNTGQYSDVQLQEL
jgi:hypothetical protein